MTITTQKGPWPREPYMTQQRKRTTQTRKPNPVLLEHTEW